MQPFDENMEKLQLEIQNFNKSVSIEEFLNKQLLKFKSLFEEAIILGGAKKKSSIIRSSKLINLIHDAVKFGFYQFGVKPENIFPPLGETKPELKIAGFLKQKNQDICIIPSNIEKAPSKIDYGPLSYKGLTDPYGFEYSTNTLIVNVRSQMSSLAKNADTLFERTFAEALNLHLRYPEIVLGEVYLIPVNEYDDNYVKKHEVAFRYRKTNIEQYISFFNAINNRNISGEHFFYERCALLIVDFNLPQPYLYQNSEELKNAGLISRDFNIEYSSLSFRTFFSDILKTYDKRYDIKNIID